MTRAIFYYQNTCNVAHLAKPAALLALGLHEVHVVDVIAVTVLGPPGALAVRSGVGAHVTARVLAVHIHVGPVRNVNRILQ